MTNRDKFEGWAKSKFLDTSKTKDGQYKNWLTIGFLEVWSEALSSVAVQLPKGESDDCGHVVNLSDVEDALDKAGIKYD